MDVKMGEPSGGESSKNLEETIFYTMCDINTCLGLDAAESEEIFQTLQDATDLSITDIITHLNQGPDTKHQIKKLSQQVKQNYTQEQNVNPQYQQDQGAAILPASAFKNTGDLLLPRVLEEPSKEMTTATTEASDSAGDVMPSDDSKKLCPPPHEIPTPQQAKKYGAIKKVRKFFGKITHKKRDKEEGSVISSTDQVKKRRVTAFVELLSALVTRTGGSQNGTGGSSSEGYSTDAMGCKFNMEEVSSSYQQIDVVNNITPALDDRKMIGQGSQGRVYLGVWQDKQVAIKEFTGGVLSNLESGALLELHRELAVMQHLNHRNIVKCYGVCMDLPHRSLILEYMDMSLHQILHKSKQDLSYKFILKVASQICRALIYMHPSIVHRDIKPSNVLYRKGVVKLADFGITAVQEHSHISTTQNRGTIQYAAPELYTEGRLNHKADIYSLGILLWEMYTRQRPWGKEQDLRVIFRVGSKGERPKIPDDMPQVYQQIVQRCWSQNAEKRPDAEEVLCMLRQEIAKVDQDDGNN